MPDIPRAAIDAAEAGLRALLGPWLAAEAYGTSLGSQIRTAAMIAVRDAEQAWPHQPPARDPASTTAAVTSVPTPPTSRNVRTHPARPFGFGQPELSA